MVVHKLQRTFVEEGSNKMKRMLTAKDHPHKKKNKAFDRIIESREKLVRLMDLSNRYHFRKQNGIVSIMNKKAIDSMKNVSLLQNVCYKKECLVSQKDIFMQAFKELLEEK